MSRSDTKMGAIFHRRKNSNEIWHPRSRIVPEWGFVFLAIIWVLIFAYVFAMVLL